VGLGARRNRLLTPSKDHPTTTTMVFAGYLNTGCRRYANAAKRTLCSERILRTSNGFLTKKTTNASRLFSASPLRTAAKEKIDNAYSHTLCLPKTALPNRRSAEVEQSLRERFDILYKWQVCLWAVRPFIAAPNFEPATEFLTLKYPAFKA
jgi:hypothetical protein